MQSEEPVGAGGRTHGIRHQADVRFGHQRWPERQLYEVQLTSGCGWAVSLLRRLLPCRANWRYRPIVNSRTRQSECRQRAAQLTLSLCRFEARPGQQLSPARGGFQEADLDRGHPGAAGDREDLHRPGSGAATAAQGAGARVEGASSWLSRTAALPHGRRGGVARRVGTK